MKKKIYLLGALLAFASCEPDYADLEYKEKPFVAFSASTISVSEGNTAAGNIVQLSISRATSDLGSALTVNFAAVSAKFETTNADASNTFTLSGGVGGSATTVVIPAGKTTANITFTSKGNTVLEKNRVIQVSLTSSSSDLNLGYPGPASNGKIITVTIADDDCTPDIGNLLGAYDCLEPGYGTYDVAFSQISCTVIQNSNFWDEGAKINYTINPVAGTVSISNQTFGTRSVTGAGGTLNLATGTIIAPYVVKTTSSGATLDTNTHTFTRKP